MGYSTPADEKLEEAREHVHDAIEALAEVVVTRTASGWDEYKPEARARWAKALTLLCDARTELENT